MIPKPNNRLLSLDVLRGITIAGMIMVNNPASWDYVYAPLRHADWHGLTPTDLVFPFFMFIMGISTFISLRKFNFEFSKSTLIKILKRTFVIFLIGLGLSWFSLSFRTYHNLSANDYSIWERIFASVTNFENLRTLGVMQRLALTYGISSLIAIFVKHKYIPHIISITLLAYFLLLFFSNGFEAGNDNILSIVDQKVLGLNHMYVEHGLDPEGILSTIPAICHVLIGFMCGKVLIKTKDNKERMLQLFIIGTILTFAGFIFEYACPVNKKIWSPSFVFVTCGLCSSLLAFLIWIIDVQGHKKWSRFFECFGVNPLFIYVVASMLGSMMRGIYIGEQDVSIKDYLFSNFLHPYLGGNFGSLIYALLFVTVNWVIGNILYKKNIYIKI